MDPLQHEQGWELQTDVYIYVHHVWSQEQASHKSHNTVSQTHTHIKGRHRHTIANSFDVSCMTQTCDCKQF